MPTLEIQEVDYQILLKVRVEVPQVSGDVSVRAGANPRFFDALVDTGAQRTFVSSNVVTHLSAVPVDLEPFLAANGQSQDTEVFRLRVDIPYPQDEAARFVISTGEELNVMLLPFQPRNFDVLLGMDFLRSFHISMHNGRCVLSN